jgi:hypothetical protein
MHFGHIIGYVYGGEVGVHSSKISSQLNFLITWFNILVDDISKMFLDSLPKMQDTKNVNLLTQYELEWENLITIFKKTKEFF